jgi:DNA-binding transcriptional regulator PaaX
MRNYWCYGIVIAPVRMSSKRVAAQGSKELLLAILQLILDKSDMDRALSKKLRYMRYQGYIAKTGSRYSLTIKGEKILDEGRIWQLRIPTPKKWDGRWRLVAFDIPVDKRKRRDIFRTRLKELGLTLYQNSVWVYPYPLENVVGQISNFYKLSACVSFIVAEEITGEASLMKRYKL